MTAIGFAPDADEIKFSHARHAKAKVECLACHESIYDAKDLKGSFLPKEAKCLECHKKEKETGNCVMCHSEPKLAATWPRREPGVKIDHAKHIELTKEDCTKCHFALKEPGIDVKISAGHDACLSCHEPHGKQFDGAQCNGCHVDLKRYQYKPAAELSHQGDFLRQHQVAAKAAGASCASCHEQNFCLDCHGRTAMAAPGVGMQDRPDRSFIHRNDFFSRHSVEAQADPASCQKCHGATAGQSSCMQCHTAQHVSTASLSPRNPHPAGWALPGAGNGFHGDAARRDATSCMSCHDQGAQSNCVSCHKVGGVGGDPHPITFGKRHSLAEARSSAVCLTCHR
jgi:hypothetical protein